MTLGTPWTLGVLITQGNKFCNGEHSSAQTRVQSVSGGRTMQWQLRCCLLASTYSAVWVSGASAGRFCPAGNWIFFLKHIVRPVICRGFLGGPDSKESVCSAGDQGLIPGGEILWRREWLPTLAFLRAEFHGQRSKAGYSPWGHKEPGTTERQTILFVGENGMQGGSRGVWRLITPFHEKEN